MKINLIVLAVLVVSITMNLLMVQKVDKINEQLQAISTTVAEKYATFGSLPIGMYQVVETYSDGVAKVKMLLGAHGGYYKEILVKGLPSDIHVGRGFDILEPGGDYHTPGAYFEHPPHPVLTPSWEWVKF